MPQINQLTRDIADILIPRAALIAYLTDERLRAESGWNYFLEARKIGDDGVMREGPPSRWRS